ncbi:RNA-directed DNA polymerase, eukaryota, reverse transcriptase zinc-binding domain protein [Tanacetum coccineum]
MEEGIHGEGVVLRGRHEESILSNRMALTNGLGLMKHQAFSRLATRPSLVARGISITDPSCPFCNQSIEDVHHVLVACPRVARVWRKVWAWWNLDMPTVFPSFSIDQIAMENVYSLGCSARNKFFHDVKFGRDGLQDPLIF